MQLSYKKRTDPKLKARRKKKVRIRKKVFGHTSRPRLTFFKSLKHVYAQLVDDTLGKTLVSSSTLSISKEEKKKLKNECLKELSRWLGRDMAKKSLAKKFSSVVFDRNGYPFHGKLKAFVEGAREEGLNF